jgi:putative ABC transport system permease protein
LLFDAGWRDVRYGVRTLWKNLRFTLLAVITVAVGVGGSTALFSIVDGALLHPWPYSGYDRIVTVRAESPRLGRRDFPLWSPSEYREISQRSEVFDYVIAGNARDVNLVYGGRAERVRAAVITANTWAMLGVQPLLGRVFTADEDRNGGEHLVVVNYRFWQTHLGGRPDVIGSTLRAEGVPYTIIGVMPRSFVWWNQDLWFPAQLDSQDVDRGNRIWYIQARMRNGLSIAQAEAALQSYSAGLQRQFGRPEYENLKIILNPLVFDVLQDLRHMLFLLLGAVFLVLIVASANVGTLQLARGMGRGPELAVRLALGASRMRVVRQLVTENLLIALLAGLLGLALGRALINPLVSLIPDQIPAESQIALDWRVGLFAIAIALTSGVLFGLAPAFRSSDVNLASVLKASNRNVAGGSGFLDIFCVVQFAVALIVLGASGFVARSYQQTLAANPGFDERGVFTFNIAVSSAKGWENAAQTYERALARFARLPGVEMTAATTTLPVGNGTRASFSAGGKDELVDANYDIITPGYFGLLRVPFASGRDFEQSDQPGSARVAIINSTLAARLFPQESAIGHRLLWHEHEGGTVELTIVGITGNMKREGFATAAAPAVFVPLEQEPTSNVAVVLRTGLAQEGLLESARIALASVDSEAPIYDPDTLVNMRANSLGSERLASVLLIAFGVIAVVLSMVGVYGVTRYAVEQKTGEIGIRMALGAHPGHILRMFMQRSVKNFGIAAVPGIPGAWIATKVLASSVVGFQRPDLGILVVATALLASTTLFAAYLPARRASSVDPLEALQSN